MTSRPAMIGAHRLPSGALLITANNSARAKLADAFALGGYPRADLTVLDHICGNGLSAVAPEALGALTEAPIIAEDAAR